MYAGEDPPVSSLQQCRRLDAAAAVDYWCFTCSLVWATPNDKQEPITDVAAKEPASDEMVSAWRV